ncbi:MAG: hypothetical protein CMO66_01050 [Verrucomicrobiales bacterium]|nr:hypothetical protein [Verrucomicrobiales bacterium]
MRLDPMKNAMIRWGTLCAVFALLTTACKLFEGGQPSMKTVMQEGFKGDGALRKKIIDGVATQADKDLFLIYAETLPGFAPKKGTPASWAEKSAAVVAAAKAIADGTGTVDDFEAATNCRGCHEPHKEYPPGKNPYTKK